MRFAAAPRLSLAALALAIAAASLPARSDELAEASKLLRTGHAAQAMERVDKILESKPGDPKARFLKGLIYTDQGNAGAAIEVFRKLTEDYPELPEPYNNLAVVYASQGQYEKARTALEQSIRTHPSYATAYENLGDVYARLASEAYDKALKLDSSNSGAQNKLALVRDLVGAAPQAAPTTAAAAAPNPPAPQAALAQPAAPEAAAPKPAPSETPQGADVLEAVRAWADAWSRQDVDAYLAAYAKDFRTPKGEPRNAWEKQRRERLTAPKSIAVDIDVKRVVDKGDGTVAVTFLQDYRSDLFSGSTRKTLVMGRSTDGHWRILQERVPD